MQFFNAAAIFTGICLLVQHICFGQLKENQEKLKVKVEFETFDFQLFTDNTYSPVTTYRGDTYFVWVDKNFRPKVGKIKNGKVSVSFLDPDPKYKVLDNNHHRFSIGVDQDGYLHIAGDMHHYPKSAVDHLPDKYKDGIIMYWVSDQPENITSFSWMGNNISRALPGYGFTYLSFHHDMDGELYARCRNRVYKGPHKPGEMGYSIYRYQTRSKRWTNLGGKAPSNPTATWNTVIWEDDSHRKENIPDFYQGFLGQMRFDFNNRLHVAGAINNNTKYDAASHVLYAYSDDRGNSFHRADGSKIKSLPIRVEEGDNRGDIIDGPDKFGTFASASFDVNGNPIITYTRLNEGAQYGMDPASYKYFHSGKWSKKLAYPTGGHVKNIPVVDANGVITFLNNNGKFMRTMNIDKPGYSVNLGGKFVSLDERAIREQNVLKGMMLKDGKLQVISLEFVPSYKSILPSPWKTVHMGSTTGSASTFNNVHQLRSSGNGFKDQAINAQFNHQKLAGDGYIEARVINVNHTHNEAFAGLMITESLNSEAFFSNIITSHNGLKTYYSSSGQMEAGKSKPNKQPSEWLRIERQGNQFSAYGSNNGKSWYLVDERTIPMDQEVYVGLVSGSGENNQGHARIDHITIQSTPTYGIEFIKHPKDLTVAEGEQAKFEVEARGTSQLSYQWIKDGAIINGANKAILEITAAELSDNGNYQVQISDGTNTVLSNKARLTVKEADNKPVDCSGFKVTPQIINETCKGNDGTVKLEVSGGQAPYAYSWSHGANGANLSNLSSGNYQVNITDNSGCTISRKITINTQPGPVKPVITRTDNLLHIEGANGLEVEWYLDGTLIDGTTDPKLAISQPGEYSVTVRDANGCFAASDVFHAEYQEPPATTDPIIGNSTIQHLKVYPVPASTDLNVDVKANDIANISYQIFSLAGNLLLDKEVGEGNSAFFSIDVSNLPAGVHLLKLKIFDEIITRRFLKH